MRAVVDHHNKTADAALLILLRQPGYFGIDCRGDLFGEKPPRIPGEVAEQEGRKQRKDRQIDKRQLERRRAE